MRIVSYNIQYGTGKDGQVDLARIAADIGNADIIALQEVERHFSTTDNADQAVELAALFPKHYWVYGAGVDLDAASETDRGRRRQFGNMVLSRWPIASSRNHLLAKTAYVDHLALQRSALEAVIATPLGPLRVYSVHLGHVGAAERQRQIGDLMTILADAPRDGGVISGRRASKHWTADAPLPPMPEPAIVLGDFNLGPETPEYELLAGGWDEKYKRLTTARHMVDAWAATHGAKAEGHTCFEHNGRAQRIDYAFLTPDLAERIDDISVGIEAQGSDHQPLFLDLK